MPISRTSLLIAPLAILATAAHAEAGDPVARMTAYDDSVIAIMKAKLPLTARLARFQALVSESYDMPAITQLVAGPAWAKASAADRQAAVAALTRHSALSLARSFKSYGGEKFTIDPKPIARGANRVVRVTISSGSDSDTLLYVLRQSGGTWRIFDVIADGVSQLAVQRADLAGTLASGGVAGMVKKLAQLDAIS